MKRGIFFNFSRKSNFKIKEGKVSGFRGLEDRSIDSFKILRYLEGKCLKRYRSKYTGSDIKPWNKMMTFKQSYVNLMLF